MRPPAALLVLLALLLAGALLVPVGSSADTAAQEATFGIVSMNGSANYLGVPADEVGVQGTSPDGLSLGTAIADDTAALRTTHAGLSFEREFTRADAATDKTDVIRRTADRIEDRKERLERRDRANTRGFANGSVPAIAFTRQRARIHAEATHLQDHIQRIRRLAREADGYSLSTVLGGRLASMSGELETLQGSVSGHVARSAAGDAQGRTVYAEASETGYTMAYVTEDTYVRETFLGDERRPDGTNAFADGDEPPLNAAHNRGYALYPWVTNHSVSPNSFGLGGSGIYRFTVDFTNGELTAYIDGATTNVFRETQRQKLSGMTPSRTLSDENGTVGLRVNKTYQTGPLEVNALHSSTGDPLNATVSVDGRTVGHTGEDGRLWLVEPRGPDRVQVTTDDNRTASIYMPS